MKKDFVLPIVVLGCICLIVSAALALTNMVTAPIIESSRKAAADAARIEVLPKADSFELLELSGIPESVTEVYKAKNDAGFVFMISAKGYGGMMSIICGIDMQGHMTDSKLLSHSETKGLGTKIEGVEFRTQFEGKDEALSGVSAISGATASSEAYIGAIKDAFTAFNTAKEAA